MDQQCAECAQPVSRFGRATTGRGRPPKFCSEKCKQINGNRRHRTDSVEYCDRICVICSVTFRTTTTSGRQTCSAPCSRKNGSRMASQARTARRMAARAARSPCERCGGPIPDTVRAHASFCSEECQQAAIHQLRNEKGTLRDYMLGYLYGISREHFNTMLAEQGDSCAICRAGKPNGKGGWHVDHDHVTGDVRGLLCHGCNLGLGNFRDRPDLLEAAAAYLRS